VRFKTREVFLIALEKKDVSCLEPLISPLQEIYSNVSFFSFPFDEFFDCNALRRFCYADFPLVVISSSGLTEFISAIRKNGTYEVVNIEHGIAPFKSYSYGPHLVANGHYIAPTQLWAERLRRLNPDKAGRVHLGGFPRLEALRELRRAALSEKGSPEPNDPQLARWMAASGERKLVILTWDTNADELDKMPDRENIAYLYHPADGFGLSQRKSSRCCLFLSNDELVTHLFCNADKVYGDFSSLSFEALAMGIPAHIFIDRRFYISDCDLEEVFFDRSSPDFGRIPETEYRLDSKLVLDGPQLAAALGDDGADAPSLAVADLPAGMLPPTDRDNRLIIADIIRDIAEDQPDISADAVSDDRFNNVMFVLDGYLQILGRPADLSGLNYYLAKIESDSRPRPVVALEVLNALAGSNEGLKRFSSGDWRLPSLKLSIRTEESRCSPKPHD